MPRDIAEREKSERAQEHKYTDPHVRRGKGCPYPLDISFQN